MTSSNIKILSGYCSVTKTWLVLLYDEKILVAGNFERQFVVYWCRVISFHFEIGVCS